MPCQAKGHGDQTDRRSNGKIDASGDQDGSERDGQQTQLNTETQDLQQIPPGEEGRRAQGKDNSFDEERSDQDPLHA